MGQGRSGRPRKRRKRKMMPSSSSSWDEEEASWDGLATAVLTSGLVVTPRPVPPSRPQLRRARAWSRPLLGSRSPIICHRMHSGKVCGHLRSGAQGRGCPNAPCLGPPAALRLERGRLRPGHARGRRKPWHSARFHIHTRIQCLHAPPPSCGWRGLLLAACRGVRGGGAVLAQGCPAARAPLESRMAG